MVNLLKMDIKQLIKEKKERGIFAPFRKLGKMEFVPLIYEYDKYCTEYLNSYMLGNANEVMKYSILELNRVLDDALTFGVEDRLNEKPLFYKKTPKECTLECLHLSNVLEKSSAKSTFFSCRNRISYIYSKTIHAFGSTELFEYWFRKVIFENEEVFGIDFADTKWNNLMKEYIWKI